MSDCIVLGAGMVGVSAALALQDRGRSVVLVDHQAPGRATSYGNAGIIQTEAIAPYALPRSPLSILAAAFGAGNQVTYRLRDLPSWGMPLMRYWLNSAPAIHRAASRHYAKMILEAGVDHEAVIARAGAEPLIRRTGLREYYRDAASLARGIAAAEAARAEFGIPFVAETGAELAKAEPHLRAEIAGAVHWTDPLSSKSPGGLVEAYAALFRRGGGVIAEGDAATLEQNAAGGWRVTTSEGRVEAPAVVIALGPWAPGFLKRFGYRIPQVIKRGYHQHFDGKGPETPFIDIANSTVMSSMAAGVRVLTGAELAAIDTAPRYGQLGRSIKAARSLYEIGAPVEETPWHGSRPCMPRMLPVVGHAPNHKGLWLNFGHGHQGFTLGPTTARLLAAEMAGERTQPELMAALALPG